MGKGKWFVAATIFACAVTQPVNARDIKAMCYTSFDGKPFITNIAPIAIPDSLKSSYEIKESSNIWRAAR